MTLKKPELTYKDGTTPCKAIGERVTLRCDIHGIITCRGPDNAKHYRRKCKAKNTMPESCALGKAADSMRKALRKKNRVKMSAARKMVKALRDGLR